MAATCPTVSGSAVVSVQNCGQLGENVSVAVQGNVAHILANALHILQLLQLVKGLVLVHQLCRVQ